MPKDHSEEARAQAQRRVREQFERQAARLEREQQETRRRDDLAREQALKRSDEARRAIEESRREALERHDRLWEEERRKLSPAPAPSFGFGGPPRRPNPRACKEIEDRYARAREDIARRYDERLQAMAERQQQERKEELFREQAASFERRVEKTLARSEPSSERKSLAREFGQRSRDKGPDIAG